MTALVTSIAWLVVIAAMSTRVVAAGGGSAASAPPPVAAAGPARYSGEGRYSGEALVIPVQGVQPRQLTDTFSQARAGGARVHDAIDIMAARGTPVVAAAAGRIEKLFTSKDGGTTIYQRSADGRTEFYYAHLDAYAPGLAEGATVARGALLGTVGSTGNADPAAPHLHFALWPVAPQGHWWDKGLPLNPYPLLRGGQ